jgi:hypothetical protein
LVKLTSWQAERHGLYTGQPPLRDVVPALVSAAKAIVRGKWANLPRLAENRAWQQWAEGEPVAGSEEWLVEYIAQGRLPRLDDGYAWTSPKKLAVAEATGSRVVVEVLDPNIKSRHRVKRGKLVLTADAAAWRGSLGS